MTNFEKIKSMTLDEMARFFCKGEFGCENCAYNDNPNRCEKEVNRHKKWLDEEEIKEEQKKEWESLMSEKSNLLQLESVY